MTIDYTTIPRLRLLQVDSTGSPNGNNLSQIPDFPVVPIYGFTFVDINNNPILLGGSSGSGTSSSSVSWASVTGKPTTYPTSSALISDSTSISQSIITAANATIIRNLIGAGTGNSNFSGSYNDLANIPPILPTVSTLIRDASNIGINILTAPDASTVRNIIGSGSSSISSLAAPSTTGTVKVYSTSPDPLVYLKTDIDSLITNLQTQISTNATQISNNVSLGGVLTGTTSNPRLASTGVSAGTYNYANVTVDYDGRVTGISANSAQFYKTPLTLVDSGSNVNLDASFADFNGVARITLVGNRNLTYTNFSDGQTIRLEVTQGGSGSNTLTLPSNVAYSSNLTSITLSTSVGLTDIITFRYRSSSNKLMITDFLKGFNA